MTLVLAWIVVSPVAACVAFAVMRRREPAASAAHWLRSAIVFGLAAGTMTHAIMLLQFGLAPAPSLPRWINWFWTALTIVDPAIAVLVVVAPRAGIATAIALMIVDVAVNVHANGGFDDWAIWLQSAFGLFVIVAAPYCWRRAHATSAAYRSAKGSTSASSSTR